MTGNDHIDRFVLVDSEYALPTGNRVFDTEEAAVAAAEASDEPVAVERRTLPQRHGRQDRMDARGA